MAVSKSRKKCSSSAPDAPGVRCTGVELAMAASSNLLTFSINSLGCLNDNIESVSPFPFPTIEPVDKSMNELVPDWNLWRTHPALLVSALPTFRGGEDRSVNCKQQDEVSDDCYNESWIMTVTYCWKNMARATAVGSPSRSTYES